ncbi:MAG: transglutaminase domain-containing protein [Clostridiales bacterium]|nr:transglutaminase domain-containing protein [Clostridiales bacterium]
MSKSGNKSKFSAVRFLGCVVLPLIAGALLGVAGAYFLRTELIDNIEGETLSTVDIEYGHPITLDCFFAKIPPNTKFITNVDLIDTGMLASYDIAIDCGGHVVHSVLNVVDRTAPTATAVPVDLYAGNVPEPSTLVKDVFDLTEVTCTYNDGEPKLDKGGNYEIGVRLTDANGNFSVVNVPFHVKKDTEGPEIRGAHDIDVMVGSESVSYREGLEIVDNYCANPTLVIDNSQVDLEHVGNYPITFTATDDVGNSTSVTVKVHVISIDTAVMSDAETQAYVEEAYRMAEEILDEIIWYEDTDVEKAMKIFYWVHNHISFMLSTPQYENWAVAAINTLTKRYSSCYGAWAVCKAMLDVCGIDNICVVRDVSNSYENFHYWCLVYLNGEWYHCDAQKYFNGVAPSGYFCFMMTDREIYNAPTNHRFVEDEYPERSTTSVQSYINVYNGSISSGFPYIDE